MSYPYPSFPPRPPFPHHHHHHHHGQMPYPPYGYPPYAYPAHANAVYQHAHPPHEHFMANFQYPNEAQQVIQPPKKGTRLEIKPPKDKSTSSSSANSNAVDQLPNSSVIAADPPAIVTGIVQQPAESTQALKVVPILDPSTRQAVVIEVPKSEIVASEEVVSAEPIPNSSSSRQNLPTLSPTQIADAAFSNSFADFGEPTPTAFPEMDTTPLEYTENPFVRQYSGPVDYSGTVVDCRHLSSTAETSTSNAPARLVYDLEDLLLLGQEPIPPPECLKESEIYSPNARFKTVPENQDRRGYNGNKGKPQVNYNKSPVSSPFVQDIRGTMGRSIPVPVPSVNGFVHLEHRADDAFTAKNPTTVSAEEKVLKKVRGILNRISAEKYASLVEQLWKEMQSGEVDIMGLVERVIDIVFDVALDQPSYSHLYAEICSNLCRRIQQLKNEKQPEAAKEGGKDGEDKALSSTLKEFRRILINRCQHRFEEGSTHKPEVPPPNAPQEEREHIIRKEEHFRRRSLGNIRFISELFKRQLLSHRIMHIVMKILLLDTKHDDPSHADLLEVLCLMLNTVGKMIDQPLAKQLVDHCFQRLEIIAKTHPVSRIRFLVLDVVELRKSNWVSRFEKPDQPERASPNARPTADTGRRQLPKLDRVSSVELGGGHPKDPRVSPKSPNSYNVYPKQKSPLSKSTMSPSAHEGVPKKVVQSASHQASKYSVDSEVAEKCSSVLQRWNTDGDLQEKISHAVNVVKDLPDALHSRFIMALVYAAVGSNKMQSFREHLPAVCRSFSEQKLMTEGEFGAALCESMQRSISEEHWVNVPRLWENYGSILSGLLRHKVVDFAVLNSMGSLLLNDTEYQLQAIAFLKPVLEHLARVEDAVEFSGEHAKSYGELISSVVAGLKGKKSCQAKANKVTSFQDCVAVLDTLAAGID